jgi:G:T-mismatch repair DNA endonuclease (very short patch repair protein)
VDLDEAKPLSHRATSGFLSRLDRSRLSLQPAFLRDVEEHVRKGRAPLGAARTHSSVDLLALASSKKPVRTDSMALRRALFARGLRYRVAARPTSTISARFDVVHSPSRVAIDVRRCEQLDCCSSQNENVLMSDALRKKYDRMNSQDLANVDVLQSNNWHREVVWAHEDSAVAAERLMLLIENRRR